MRFFRLAILIASMVSAWSASAAMVQGRVADEGSLDYLEGAQVSIVELTRRTASGADGRFSFAGVAAGTYTLRVEYLGAETKEQSITVGEGRLSIDVSLSGATKQLEEITVYGQAVGTASALNRQRSADNFITVVSADAIGKLPDQNVAEALQRLPGIYLQRDQGEGRFIGIRGMDPNLNSTRVNGLNVPAPESGRRSVALDVIPSELLAGLEVSKTFTPDMDADGIGGHINVKSLSAFDQPGRRLNVTVEQSFNELQEKSSPKFSVLASDVFDFGSGSDNLGIAATFSWEDRGFGSENVETDGGWDDLETEGGAEFFGAEEIEQRDYEVTRERLGFTFNADYRASDQLSFFSRTLYSDFSDQEYRNRNEFKFDDGDAISGTDTSATWANAVLEKSLKDRLETQTIFSTISGFHWQGDRWQVGGQLGLSSSEEEEPDRLDTTFVVEDVELGYTAIGDIPALFADPATTVAGNFVLDEITFEDNIAEDDETTLSLDLTRELTDWGYNGDFSTGIKLRTREKVRDDTIEVYDGFPGDPDLTGFTQGVDYGLQPLGGGISPAAVSNFFFSNRSMLDLDDGDTLIDSTGADYSMEEDVTALYLMSRYRSENWQLVYGVRWEQTDFTAAGQRILIDDVNGSGDPELVPVTFARDFDHVFPSLNLRYRLSDKLQFRAAYSKTISRPNYGELSPGGEIEFEEDDGETELGAEIGNPLLEATESDNLDFSLEYYPGGIGVLSAAVFTKSLTNPIVIVDVADTIDLSQFVGAATVDDAEVIQPVNGDDADLTGIELAWTWLPGGQLEGMLVTANATLIDAEATLAGRTIPLPGMSETVWNLAVGYESDRINLRLAGTFKSEALLEVLDFEDPRFDRYQDEHFQLDFSGKYNISDQLTVFFNAANLTDEPFYAYFDRKQYNSQYEEYGRTYIVGLRYGH